MDTEIGKKTRTNLKHFELKKQITALRTRLKLVKNEKKFRTSGG